MDGVFYLIVSDFDDASVVCVFATEAVESHDEMKNAGDEISEA